MALALQAIEDFLPKVEGQRATTGYIPAVRNSDGKTKNFVGKDITDDPTVAYQAAGHFTAFTALGASGVTIATGVDVGQTNYATFMDTYMVKKSIAEKFNPYFTRKKDDALKALYIKPITITNIEAEAIDEGVHRAYAVGVAKSYDACKPAHSFIDLPPQAQAAIFSLCYQNGNTGAKNKNPAAWAALVAGDWAKASNLFINGEWPAYKDRRKQEGQLLAQIIA